MGVSRRRSVVRRFLLVLEMGNGQMGGRLSSWWLVPISHHWQFPTFFPSQKEGASLGTMAGGIGGGGTWIHPHHIIVFRLVYWAHLGRAVSMRQLAVGAAEEQGGGSQEEGEKRLYVGISTGLRGWSGS